jgi:hypothetical protein
LYCSDYCRQLFHREQKEISANAHILIAANPCTQVRLSMQLGFPVRYHSRRAG